MSPKLLYLIGDPNDPEVVWVRPKFNQFQRKTLANRLRLRRKLNNLKLSAGGCMQDHLKTLIGIYDELSVIKDILRLLNPSLYIELNYTNCCANKILYLTVVLS